MPPFKSVKITLRKSSKLEMHYCFFGLLYPEVMMFEEVYNEENGIHINFRNLLHINA